MEPRRARRSVRRVAVQEVGPRPEAALIACPAAVLPRVARLVRAEVARPVFRVAVRYPARPSVVAAPKVRALRQGESVARGRQPAEPVEQPAGLRLAEQPVALAEAAAEAQREEVAPQALAAQPKAGPGVLAARDAAAGPQPVVASGVEVRQPEAAAGRDAAAGVQPQGVARAAVAAVRLPGAVRVAEVRRRVAPGEAAPLLAAAWVALPSTRRQGDRLGPSEQARSAHAWICLRTAQP